MAERNEGAVADAARRNEQITDGNWRAYQRMRDSGHLQWIEDARKFDNYYRGEQWETEVAAALDAEGRPHLTLNLCLSTVNAAVGEYIRQRRETFFKPMGAGATSDTANTLNLLFGQIDANNRSQWLEQQMVLDGLVEDRGYLDIRIDFSDNILGEVRETVPDPRDVLIDTFASEYDPSTWNEVIVSRWLTLDDIEGLYGKAKADELGLVDPNSTYGSDSLLLEPQRYGDTNISVPSSWPNQNYLDKEETRKVLKVRVIDRQYRRMKLQRFFVDPIEGDMRPVPDEMSDERAREVAQMSGVGILRKPVKRIRWTTTADHVLLHDDWSIYNRLTIIPFFPYFRRGRPFGLLRNLISPQDMLNKLSSQELHVVNTTANSGWTFESGTLVNMTADELTQTGAMTGLVLEYQKGATPPAKIEPNSIPTGLDRLSEKCAYYMREISGINAAMLGGTGREISGEALEEKRSGALAQMEVVFDNLAKTRHYRAEHILDLVQTFYTERRMLHITQRDEAGEETSEQIEINAPTPEGHIANDLTIGEYEVVVSSVPRFANQEDLVFAQIKEMRELGVVIPDWVFIEHSSIPNKQEIADVVRKISGMAEPTQEEVEYELKVRDLQLQTMMANLRETMAKSLEREANAQLTLVQAGITQQQPLLEMQKLGVETRKELETQLLELQKHREDLAVRLQMIREKNASAEAVAGISSMTKRVESAARREVDLKKVAATAAKKTTPASSGKRSATK